MRISIKYHEILEESLKEELLWLKEEFEILFKSKIENYTREIANDILDYILENSYVYDNIALYNLLLDAMENIEKNYPDLF